MRSWFGGRPKALRSVRYNKYERRHATAKKAPRLSSAEPNGEDCSATLQRRLWIRSSRPDKLLPSKRNCRGFKLDHGLPAPQIFAHRSQLSAASPSLTSRSCVRRGRSHPRAQLWAVHSTSDTSFPIRRDLPAFRPAPERTFSSGPPNRARGKSGRPFRKRTFSARLR